MKVNRSHYAGNIIPFQARIEDLGDRVDDGARDHILRLLDLSKFERPRRPVENDANMRTNIVAMVLLGLLVFIAKEDFSRLERSNLCLTKSECMY